MPHTILRLPDVINRTGLARSTIYLYVSKGLFPKPVKLGVRAVGWLDTEVENWIETRVRITRAASES